MSIAVCAKGNSSESGQPLLRYTKPKNTCDRRCTTLVASCKNECAVVGRTHPYSLTFHNCQIRVRIMPCAKCQVLAKAVRPPGVAQTTDLLSCASDSNVLCAYQKALTHWSSLCKRHWASY